MAGKGGLYARGEFWLDHDRGKNGKPLSPWLYICWYCPDRGRLRRKSTRERDLRLASDALDQHYLTVHRPTEGERRNYTVAEAMIDYWHEKGSKAASAEAIHARLKLMTRFMNEEAAAGRLVDPFITQQVDDAFIRRFRIWGVIDPIISRRKNDQGEWVEASRRKRAASTVEESVIQLKAVLNHAKSSKRSSHSPDFGHRSRAQVTPVRNDRLSLPQIGELLNFTIVGNGSYAGHAERLLPLRRYIIAAICTLGRPDAILDMSISPGRGQWHRDVSVFDPNPSQRIQTKKYRAAVPAISLLCD